MNAPGGSFIELAKYPVTVFSILIAVIVAKFVLGISFGQISEVSANGVKFVEASSQQIAELDSRLKGVEVAVMEIRNSVPRSANQRAGDARIAEATQTVSEQSARLAKLGATIAATPTKLKGFIWVGDYNTKWERVRLGEVDTSQPITSPPDKLQAGSDYVVLGNIFVRDALPSNDKNYFHARTNLGIIATGTKVRLLSPPKGIDRGFAIQYWAQIETL